MNKIDNTDLPLLWGRATSINVQKVLWLAEELGLQLRRIDAGMHHGVVNTSTYIEMNPNKLVPTLQDGDLTIWESNTIVRYIARKFAPNNWLPIESGNLASMEKWMDWSLSKCAVCMGPLYFQLIVIPESQKDQSIINNSKANAKEVMLTLAGALEKNSWLAGSEITLADIACAPFVYRWLKLPIERPTLPILDRYVSKLMEREAFLLHVAVKLGV